MLSTISRRDPDSRGYFGEFGGRYVPETLVQPIEELERAYLAVRDDAQFARELNRLLKHYVGRPTPMYEAARLTEAFGGARIFLKREDLTHTGAHKINNALGQALLAVRMGKHRIVADCDPHRHVRQGRDASPRRAKEACGRRWRRRVGILRNEQRVVPPVGGLRQDIAERRRRVQEHRGQEQRRDACGDRRALPQQSRRQHAISPGGSSRRSDSSPRRDGSSGGASSWMRSIPRRRCSTSP